MFRVLILLPGILLFTSAVAQDKGGLLYYVQAKENQKFLIPFIESTIRGFRDSTGGPLCQSVINFNLLNESSEVEYGIFDFYIRNQTTPLNISNSTQRLAFDKKLSKFLEHYSKLLVIYIEEFNDQLEFQFWLYDVSTSQVERDVPVFNKLSYRTSSIFINPSADGYKDKLVFALKQIFREANTPPKVSIGIGNNMINGNTYFVVNSEVSFTALVTDLDSPEDNFTYFWTLSDEKGDSIAIKTDDKNQILKFARLGSYRLALKVSDGLAYSDTAQIDISVIQKPSIVENAQTLYLFSQENDVKNDDVKQADGIQFEMRSNSADSLERLNFELFRQGTKRLDTLNLEAVSNEIDSTMIREKLMFGNLIVYKKRRHSGPFNVYTVDFYRAQDLPLGSLLLKTTPEIGDVSGRPGYLKLRHYLVTRVSVTGGVSFFRIKNRIDPRVSVSHFGNGDSITFKSLLWSFTLGVKIEPNRSSMIGLQCEFPFQQPSAHFSRFRPNYRMSLSIPTREYRLTNTGIVLSFLLYFKSYSFNKYNISGRTFKTGIGITYLERLSAQKAVSISANWFPRRLLFYSNPNHMDVSFSYSILELSFGVGLSILKKRDNSD